MTKYRYQQPENYTQKKKIILEMFDVYFGGHPAWANERVIRALIKIWDYYEEKFPNLRIPASAIPDNDRFLSKAESYSIISFIFNRMHVNLKNGIVIEKNNYSKNSITGQEETGVEGAYAPAEKQIVIYERALENSKSLKALAERYETEEDCKEAHYEATLIHEILHMLSDDGASIGFFWFDDENFRAFNEGMTESLACDIAGFKDRHVRALWFKQNTDNKSYLINSQTHAYNFESCILNLVRLSSARNPDLPYLVGHAWRYDKEGKNMPDQRDSRLVQKFCEIKEAARRGDMLPVQQLQGELIQDFEKNRYMPIVEKIQAGQTPDPNEYKRLVEDVLWIGQNLCMTFTKFLTDEEKKFYASLDIQKSRRLLNKMIKEKVVEATPNVQVYLSLLNRVIEIGRDFHNELSDFQQFYRQPI